MGQRGGVGDRWRWALAACLWAVLARPAVAIVNGGFETGDLSGWTVTNGTVGAGYTATVVNAGPAPNTAGNLNRVDQGTYACQLHSGTGGLGTTFISISQDHLVDAANTILRFRYAAVLNGTHSSTPLQDASMSVVLSAGASTLYSETYRYAQSPAPLVDDGVPNWRHLPWTTIQFDLTAQVGELLTITFEARDCLQGGHYSLAYVDGFEFVPPTPTVTPTASPTFTVSPTPTASPTFTVSPTFTTSPTPTASPTATVTGTFTVSPTVTPTPTITLTHTITNTFTATPPPLSLTLYPPNPNPSNNGVWLPYRLGTDADVNVKVWTVSGEPVCEWPEGFQRMGLQEAFWDHKNAAGTKVGSGIFIYRIHARSPANEETQLYGKCAVSR